MWGPLPTAGALAGSGMVLTMPSFSIPRLQPVARGFLALSLQWSMHIFPFGQSAPQEGFPALLAHQ